MSEQTIHHRQIEIDATRAETESRTAPATLSTEFPVPRAGYQEVLVHEPGAIDLSRAPLPLIEAHDNSRVNVGVVEDIRLEGRKLRGTIRMGASARATELWKDIQAGIVRNLSIGYQWLDFEDGGEELVRVTRWAPYEASLVAAPADPGAGLYRSQNTMTDTNTPATEPKLSRSQRRAAAGAIEDSRFMARQVYAMRQNFKIHEAGEADAQEFDEIAQRVIAGEAPLEELRDCGNFIDRARYLNSPTSNPVGAPPESHPLQYLPTAQHQRSWAHRWQNDRTTEQQHRAIQEQSMDLAISAAGNGDLLAAFGRDYASAQRNTFESGMWLRANVMGDSNAKRWLSDYGSSRAMAGSSSTKGAALVPEVLASSIVNLAKEFGVARQYCRNWPMASNNLFIPRKKTGVTGYYLGEGAEITSSDLTFDQIELAAKKYAALIVMSTELAEDSVIDLANFVVQEVGRTFAEAEDRALFGGDGTSSYGEITGLRAALAGKAGAIAAAATHDTFAEVDEADLTKLISKLPSYARRGAAWFVSPEFNDMCFQRLALEAGGVSMVEVGGVRLESYRGYPIVLSDAMPAAADAGDGEIVAIFGDLAQGVAFGDRRTIQVRTDESRFLEYDQIAVRVTERFDIVCHDVGDNSTVGPVVGLELTT